MTEPKTHPKPNPTQSPEKRDAALRRANEVRGRRAGYWRLIKSGERLLVAEILDPPWWLQTCRVHYAIQRIDGLGVKRADRIMSNAKITTRRQMGAMTNHEIHRLLRSWRRWERRTFRLAAGDKPVEVPQF